MLYRFFFVILSLMISNVYSQEKYSENKKIEKDFQKVEKLYRSQKFEKAKRLFEDIDSEDSALSPTSEIDYLLGNIEFALGNFEESRVAYYNFIKDLDSNDSRKVIGQLSLGRATARLNYFEQDKEDQLYRDSLKLAPKVKKKYNPEDYKVFERVPIYPGCELVSGNAMLKSCMQSSMNNLITSRFQKGLISSVFPYPKGRIETKFKINSEGKLEILQVKGVSPLLEIEAIRVLNTIPALSPGIQRDKPLSIIYRLPIDLTFVK
ncbi:tetratricopeptide repeat protein [Nonlabens marinus]|uniref:TonB family protein n=1 Tax=Nonlabens marinus S1-08 TaxID=1454201 RepID=W8VWF2_9FLAO|nr:hypothetical protein [Nonlabens marinus]BAO56288.1 TonB family protein [Nonlabens marinus S1-08]